ncbi:MAG: hypothetical protein U0790_00895 [Isosphaeraceae bacterium]
MAQVVAEVRIVAGALCSSAEPRSIPLFDAFDSPDLNLTCPERNVSVNAPRA